MLHAFTSHTHVCAHACTHMYTSSAVLSSPCLQVGQELQTHCESSITLKLNVVEARRRLEGKETSDLLRLVKPT